MEQRQRNRERERERGIGEVALEVLFNKRLSRKKRKKIFVATSAKGKKL